jgi:FkbM family methyltransferase
MKNPNLVTLSVHDLTVAGTDLEELRQLKKEIFVNNCYYFEAESLAPRILDIGAHVGMSSLYFHRQYPQAKILAVEPHPLVFQILQKNLSENLVTNVTPVQAAVVSNKQDGADPVSLHADPNQTWLSTASLLPKGWTKKETTQQVTVPTINFSELFSEKYLPNGKIWDIVKIDIEGYEKEQLLNAGPELQKIKQLTVEAHDWSKQELKDITDHLQQHGLHLQQENQIKKSSELLVVYDFVR